MTATWAGYEIVTAPDEAPAVWRAGHRVEACVADSILREILRTWRMCGGRLPAGSIVEHGGAQCFVVAVGTEWRGLLMPSDAPTHADLLPGEPAAVPGFRFWRSSGPSVLVPLADIGAAQGVLL